MTKSYLIVQSYPILKLDGMCTTVWESHKIINTVALYICNL